MSDLLTYGITFNIGFIILGFRIHYWNLFLFTKFSIIEKFFIHINLFENLNFSTMN